MTLLKFLLLSLYSSSRLGIWEPNQRLTPSVDTTKKWQIREGQKRYELTNHLGNVLVTVNDRRRGTDSNADTFFDFYDAIEITATDYYPFGLEMPNRTFQATAYRYGFNGKENDRGGTWSAVQLVQDYGMRLYNPAIGKFLSVDPIGSKFPWLTPYQFAGNTPIWAIDLDGLEPAFTTSSPAARDDALRNPIKPYVEPTYQGNDGKPLQEVVVTAARLNVSDKNNRKNVQSLNDGSGGITFTQGDTRVYQYNHITGSRYYAQAPGRASEMVRDDGQKHNEYLQTIVSAHETIAYTNVVLIGTALSLGTSTIAEGAFYRSSSMAFTRSSATLLRMTQLEVKIAQIEASALANLRALEQGISKAHFLSRHGAGTTLQQQLVRSTSGLTPDGVAGKAVNSTRFFNYRNQEEAYRMAVSKYAGKGSETFDMGKTIGEGFFKGGQTYGRTSQVTAFYNSAGEVITLFPKL